MGRSVSYASGSVARAYVDISYMGNVEDEEGNSYLCEVQAVYDWEDWVCDIIAKASKHWPSFTPCDKWLGREDHAILENNLAYVGVSEYCGLACVWLCPKQDDGGFTPYLNMAEAWCNKIKPNFEKQFSTLRKVGTFSNGEALFEKVASNG